MTIGKIRSLCYVLGRGLGDVQAILGGPKAIVKRLLRKFVGRGLGRLMRRI